MKMADKPEDTKVSNSKEDYELKIQSCIFIMYDQQTVKLFYKETPTQQTVKAYT